MVENTITSQVDMHAQETISAASLESAGETPKTFDVKLGKVAFYALTDDGNYKLVTNNISLENGTIFVKESANVALIVSNDSHGVQIEVHQEKANKLGLYAVGGEANPVAVKVLSSEDREQKAREQAIAQLELPAGIIGGESLDSPAAAAVSAEQRSNTRGRV